MRTEDAKDEEPAAAEESSVPPTVRLARSSPFDWTAESDTEEDAPVQKNH